MPILAAIKRDYQTLRDGRPGQRFRHYAEERRKRRGGKQGLRRVLSSLLGVALIVIGIAIGWLPGPGGFLAIIGLALIAKEVPWIANVLDAFELGVRRAVRSIRRLVSKHSEKCNGT